jgi:plasmid stabilization system protein ParE
VTLPVVWTPEADADLGEARAWYENIRPELGARFARAVEAAVESIAENPLQFPVVYRAAVVREYDVSPMEYSSRRKSVASW